MLVDDFICIANPTLKEPINIAGPASNNIICLTYSSGSVDHGMLNTEYHGGLNTGYHGMLKTGYHVGLNTDYQGWLNTGYYGRLNTADHGRLHLDKFKDIIKSWNI